MNSSDTFDYLRLDLVYSRKIAIYVVSLACASVFSYYYYRDDLQLEFIAWLTSFAFYFFLRKLSVDFYWKNKSTRDITISQFELINSIICFYGGLLWGTSSILFLTDVPSEKMLIAMTIYAGVCAGATGSNGATLKGNYAFNFALIISAIIGFSLGHSEVKETLIIIFLLYLVGLAFNMQMVNQSIVKNISLRLDKEYLLSEIEESDRKRINTERQALQSSKMAAIGEMASGMAHEINNPLTIIRGNLTLLSRRIKSMNSGNVDDLSETSINRCLENVERIAKTIDSLKKMSKNDKNTNIEEVEISKIVDDAVGFINEKLKCSNIKFYNEVNECKSLLVCNSTSISQILLSLITNAFQLSANKPHGWIKLDYNEDNKFSYFEVSHSSCEVDKDEIKNALNQTSELIQNPLVYNLILAQALSSENQAEIYMKTTMSGYSLVLKISRNQIPSTNVAA